MDIRTFAAALYKTPVSSGIRDVTWIIPTTQSIHILAVAVIVGSALVSDLRLAGVLASAETPRTVIRRYLPWMWAALAILLTTGTILSVGEPNRVFMNWVFWTKMGLVLFGFLLTLAFRYPILKAEFSLDRARWAALVKPLAWLSILVWVAVIFCGRWIAYVI